MTELLNKLDINKEDAEKALDKINIIGNEDIEKALNKILPVARNYIKKGNVNTGLFVMLLFGLSMSLDKI
jgi:hypothetical protein